MDGELIQQLRKQADEIAKEGHAGWGNTMLLAAERIEALDELRLSALNDGFDMCKADYREQFQEYEEEIERLRSALVRVTHNFQLAIKGKPVRDMAETLAEVERALGSSHLYDLCEPKRDALTAITAKLEVSK